MERISIYKIERGATAYEAFCKAANGILLATGKPFPEWEELREELKVRWIATADAIVKKYCQF